MLIPNLNTNNSSFVYSFLSLNSASVFTVYLSSVFL
jgi:hypothetical protein